MLVKDLIKILETMPQNEHIYLAYLSGEDGGWSTEEERDIISVYHEDDYADVILSTFIHD